MNKITDLATALPSIFTVSDIMDKEYMENILGTHYEKYKAFVRLLMKLDDKVIESIKKIECAWKSCELSLVVHLPKKNVAGFTKVFKCKDIKVKKTSPKCFKMTVSHDVKFVNITIENKGFLEEVEIYESGSDTY